MTWADKDPMLLELVPPRAPRSHCSIPGCYCDEPDHAEEPYTEVPWQSLLWCGVIILGSGIVLLSLILHTIDIMRWLFT